LDALRLYPLTILEMSEDVMTAEKIIAALAALAHEHRLGAYRLLVEAGPNGLPAGEVAERLGLPPSSLTFHLQHMLRAELITQRRQSRQLIYATNFAAMNGLVAYLTENCCGQGESVGCAAAICKPGAPSKRGRASTRRKSA
jgi:ArsR family transcriptional regulator, arsenate/arsenite/antimonite-responsive transcriptional repressor